MCLRRFRLGFMHQAVLQRLSSRAVLADRIARRVVERAITDATSTRVDGGKPLLHPAVQFENLHLGADEGHADSDVVQDATHLGFARRQGVLGPLALGNVDKQNGELIGRRSNGRHVEVLAQLLGVVLKTRGLARQGHTAIGFDPVALVLGENIQDRLADDIAPLESGHSLEGRVDGQKAIVHRSTRGVADDLV